MITVTLGTIPYPFDRAISWINTLLETEIISEPLFIQSGYTDVSTFDSHPLVQTDRIVDSNELIRRVKQSSIVISHAGQGSTRMLVAQGVPFVLLPRLAKYKEHIDNHQLFFARSMHQLGIKYCLQIEALKSAIADPPSPYQKNIFEGPQLSDYLNRHYSNNSYLPNYKN